MKLLIVGGAGHVGSIIRTALEKEHDCRYFDIRPVPGAEDRTIVADVHDDAAVAKAMAGIEAVAYLAMGKGPNAENPNAAINDITAAFGVNVAGVYRFLAHGLGPDGSLKRFVYASSLSVYHRVKPKRRYVDETVPPDGHYPYAITKRLGEEVCRMTTEKYPHVTIVALRLVLPKADNDWPYEHENKDSLAANCATGPNDMRRLYLAALKFDKPGYFMMQCSGDLTGKKIPNDRAREILGWMPEGN
jgi:nucleoside-diphosphate-sugar epimerase